MTVLILGNGLSRLAFDKKIREFRGPVWGCNRAYLDYGDKLAALAGHADVMVEAQGARDALGQQFKIFGQDEEFTARELFRKDTGTTLVAEALTRGFDVIVCGFDLGGPDVYSPGHERKNKTTWVSRWRLIFQTFDPARVTFWGYDHKPFILSGEPAATYARKYTRGENHIPDETYQKAVNSWTGDYSRVFALVPQVYLKNIGKREWKFLESDEQLRVGRRIVLPEEVAKKYMALYKFEFEIEPLV
jgi:hypothetical protein